MFEKIERYLVSCNWSKFLVKLKIKRIYSMWVVSIDSLLNYHNKIVSGPAERKMGRNNIERKLALSIWMNDWLPASLTTCMLAAYIRLSRSCKTPGSRQY